MFFRGGMTLVDFTPHLEPSKQLLGVGCDINNSPIQVLISLQVEIVVPTPSFRSTYAGSFYLDFKYESFPDMHVVFI